jgi:hypothetical protein
MDLSWEVTVIKQQLYHPERAFPEYYLLITVNTVAISLLHYATTQ